MPNLTMAIDGDVLRKVRKLSVEKDTSLTGMVREYLERLASREDERVEETVAELRECFAEGKTKIGKRTWTREDLHDRQDLH